MEQTVIFPSGSVQYFHSVQLEELLENYKGRDIIFLTDSNIAALYPQLFADKKTVVILPGETNKNLNTIDDVVRQMLQYEATRNTLLLGIGGGMVTDITGLAAATYMRGIAAAFVPTTLLGMADAAIGGKNGVNSGVYKNMIGTIRQPEFIAYDIRFLKTLPDDEWSNGFAEIIKYACLFDTELFETLSAKNINWFKTHSDDLQSVINTCVYWKNKTVAEDEHESGMRKLLNFGHTAAHAIENLYGLPHGKAVSIGMVIAATLSEQLTGFGADDTLRLKKLLMQYNLPISYPIDSKKAVDILKMDKKRNNNTISYILLNNIGIATIKALPFDILEKAIETCALQYSREQ